METVGERIKRLREAQQITQAALGAAVGVTVGQVSRWERDVGEPSLSSLRALAAALRASCDQIVGTQ